MLIWVIYASSALAQTDFSKIVIFGDSLSDTGNLSSVFGALPFPYFNNRISDGTVAVDRLAQLLGDNAAASLHLANQQSGYNYAVAGGAIVGNEDEDLTAQVDAFVSRVTNSTDPSALYLIMIGGNDLRSIRGTASVSTASSQIDLSVSSLVAQITRLINAGATNFFIANSPNIGRIPETLSLESSNPGISARAQNYTQILNQRLSAQLNTLFTNTNRQLIEFDFYSAFESLLNNAASLGYTQTSVGCFSIGSFSFHPDCNFGLTFDRFVFFDNIHPTGKAHRMLGDAMFQKLQASPSRSPVISAIIMLLLGD